MEDEFIKLHKTLGKQSERHLNTKWYLETVIRHLFSLVIVLLSIIILL